MAFPNDLNNVIVFKIHPAIGVARVSKSNQHYVFGKDPGSYKANGQIKRQAVQFRIFAYGANHVGLGELTPDLMALLGVTAVWSARVANRKIARMRNVPVDSTDYVISASASSNDPTGGQLTGSLPDFAEGAAIPLGQITGTGLFIPPPGGVHRRQFGQGIPHYPNFSDSIADTTSDGWVTARITHGGQELPVLPAGVVVAPQDFSPDTNETTTLWDYFLQELGISPNASPGNLHNQTARAIDRAALAPGTADFMPGFELCFEYDTSEAVDVASVCYRPGTDTHVDPREARLKYREPGAPGSGAVPGQLTSGLCSPWQCDFTACVGYWSEHLPRLTFLDENSNVQVMMFRKRYDEHGPGATTLSSQHGDEFEQHVDKMGVERTQAGKRVETERNLGDDVP